MHCEVFFVFNGTAANSLALASTGQSYHSILCHEIAHVETDECGAPEFFSNGMKVLQISGSDGKIDPAGIYEVFLFELFDEVVQVFRSILWRAPSLDI